ATRNSTCFYGCLRMSTEQVMCCWRTPPSLARYLAATRVSNTSGRTSLLKGGHLLKEGSMTPEGNVLLDPVAAVRQYIDSFNKGDGEAMASTFAASGSILDGMAPHVWQGPTASQDLYQDVLTEAKQHGASDYSVKLGEPLHDNTTGDSAYVVVPA